MTSPAHTFAHLVPISGPPLPAIEVPADGKPHRIGRHERCDLRLPSDAETVSRAHARLTSDGGHWRLADLQSRWGTFLNGVRLEAGIEVPLAEGDLIRIMPWTFSFSTTGPARRALQSVEDDEINRTLVRAVEPQTAAPLANDLLALLLEAAAGLHAAPDEQTLAQVILNAAVRGAGLPNAALIRPLDNAGGLEIIAAHSSQPDAPATFSRSLLKMASTGVVAELSASADAPISASIVELHISAAICVPLMLNGTVAGYLHLDARDASSSARHRPALRSNASTFCQALGRMASLAMSNLKRQEIERRQAAFLAELSAAAAAQKLIMPPRTGVHGAFTYLGESRAGQYVGGDFFDVMRLDDHRVALALGDVSGKGISASVLMTAAQGFLHAALIEHADVAKAVNHLNRYIAPRCPTGKFVTLWVGLFDLAAHTISYVDAGHGYALLMRDASSIESLASGAGLPVGVDDGEEYRAELVAMPETGRAIVVSDGIIEQYSPAASPTASPGAEAAQFGLPRVRDALAAAAQSSASDPVASLFQAVVSHAQGAALSDDATAVLLKW